MDAATRARLLELNRVFYTDHALAFADSRPRLKPGMRRVLAQIAPGARVLEAGCGDGQFARALAASGPHTYFGLDFSPTLLARARELTEKLHSPAASLAQSPSSNFQSPSSLQPPASSLQLPASTLQPPASLTFLLSDLTAPAWPLPAEPFDWALAFSVLHHIPGQAARAELLARLAARLAPGGRLALSVWRFDRSPRLMAKSQPWESAGLTADSVEPGDHLLTWERAGRAGVRYAHLLDQAEMHACAAPAGLTLTETFVSDGENGQLADYTLLQKTR